jgi:hypothetical protein
MPINKFEFDFVLGLSAMSFSFQEDLKKKNRGKKCSENVWGKL